MVYRDKGEDYGIDSEIEIFDDNGNTTGLVFWVQLKGTASNERKVIQNFIFKNDKLDQFKNYDIPVLIVRYSTSNKALYIRWAKSVFRLNREAKGTKVTFFDHDIWTNKTTDNIFSYLNRQIEIKQGKVRLPVKTFISRTPTEFNANIPYSNLVLVKNYISSKTNYFNLTNDENDSLLQIRVENKQMIFSFTDVTFSSLGLDYDHKSPQLDEDVLKHILLTFSSSLFELHKNDLGNIVFFNNDLFSLAKLDPIYLRYFLPHLLSGPNFKKTMQLVNKFLAEEKRHDTITHSIVNIILLAERNTFDEEQLSITEEFLLQSLSQANKYGDIIGMGSSCYNLGNYYRGLGNYSLSLTYYLEARRHNPWYKTHAYYFHEIAGQLYLLGRFKFAGEFYKKALDLDPNSYMAKGLLADCLMYSGKYELALARLDEFLTEKHDSYENLDEFYLKFSCLQTLLINGYPTSQHRDSKTANLLAVQGEYRNALLADMLSPHAWFSKGINNAKDRNEPDAFIAFLMASLICINDVVAWTNATLLGFNDVIDKMLLVNVIKTAHFYNGHNYVNEVFEALNKIDPPHKDHIMDLLDQTLPKTPEKAVFVRIFDNDKDFTVINLNI